MASSAMVPSCWCVLGAFGVGDSGGPFFDGNVGVGVLTHDVDTTKAIYMAFDLIEDKGLTLDTD